MQLVLIGIMLLCGYFYLYQAVAKRAENKNALPVIAIVLLLIYILVSLPLVYIISQMGDTSFVMMSLLILLACAMIFAGVLGMVKNWKEINKGALALFLVYLLSVGYIAIFSRSDRGSTEILMVPFASITKALKSKTQETLNHMLLNVAMFVPAGALFPFIHREKLAKWRYILPLGLACTITIECLQLLLRLGQCDIDDIIANTLGAIVGFIFFKIYDRFIG